MNVVAVVVRSIAGAKAPVATKDLLAPVVIEENEVRREIEVVQVSTANPGPKATKEKKVARDSVDIVVTRVLLAHADSKALDHKAKVGTKAMTDAKASVAKEGIVDAMDHKGYPEGQVLKASGLREQSGKRVRVVVLVQKGVAVLAATKAILVQGGHRGLLEVRGRMGHRDFRDKTANSEAKGSRE